MGISNISYGLGVGISTKISIHQYDIEFLN